MGLMFSQDHKKNLLKLARDSIKYGLEHKQVLPIKSSDYATELQESKACFVTLHMGKNLRGCIGSLQAYRPLVLDVAKNAFAAAFQDPRFSPLSPNELDQVSISISVLSKPKPLEFDSEEDLLAKIRPQVDGLILTEGQHRGTFLPAVWESLPNAKDFLNQLKLKAGLSPDYWSETIRMERYTSEEFSE